MILYCVQYNPDLPVHWPLCDLDLYSVNYFHTGSPDVLFFRLSPSQVHSENDFLHRCNNVTLSKFLL